jgi:hypothetical protein
VLVESEKFAKGFPRRRWCHVKITYDGAGAARFLLDGKPFAEGKGQVFREGKAALTFTLGPFRGLVDEVRVSRTVRN